MLKAKKTHYLQLNKVFFTVFILAFASIANSQWLPEIRLTNSLNYSATSYNGAWCIASSGTDVHVVWTEDLSGNGEIYYKRSTDAGINWTVSLGLTNNAFLSESPSIAVSGNVVHVAWFDHRDGNTEIYYKRSTDAGVNWGADTRMTNNTAHSYFPSVATSGSVAQIVWEDYRNGNPEIYFKRSTDAGASWGADTRLTNDTSSSEHPSIAIAGTTVNVVWYDNRNGNDEIYFKRSTDGGISWGADTRLTNNSEASLYPTIAISGSYVHVGWQDYRDGNAEIYYKRSTDAGLSWESDIRLTNNSAFSYYPSLAVSNSKVHLVWQDLRDGNWEIYYKGSTNSGVIWGTDTRLTTNIADSYSPSVAISGNNVQVVWYDNRDLNEEIYFKRDPNGNLTEIGNINLEIPTKYSLSQNFPNPFNPTTKVKFDVARLSDVKIVVYDVMGREVQTLVNEQLKPGTYEATFDGNDLNSGVYFYKITTNGFTETKRMLLLK